MDRGKFYASLRTRDSGVFGTRLSQEQVDGIEAILAACDRNDVWPLQHRANILAQVYRETGGHMLGVKETVYASHKDKNPSDAAVIKRLDAAWKKGQLGKVKTPYWRDGWFGRGPIQITHYDNYLKFEKLTGVPLTKKPSLALDPIIGADIAVIGMSRGMFTGKKLSDYPFPDAIDYPAKENPRRIVNGPDGSDKNVAGFHRAFADALREAGYVGQAPKPSPVTPVRPDPIPNPKLPDIALDAGATVETDVVLVDGPKKDETQVVLLPPTQNNPPAKPTLVPTTKKGFAVLAAIITSFIAAAVKYFGG